MTLLDRLRAWLGFDADGTTEADDDGAGSTAADRPAPQVVHRDDRPLETPSAMDRTEPPAPGSGSGTRGSTDGDDAGTDAGTDARSGRTDPAPEAEAESIPDAEATADDEQPGSTAVGPPDSGGESGDTAFVCSVCGTTVDDPSEPCPLCRSTDVGAVGGGTEPSAHGGRTAVSTADDDEAVDRLRDVRGDE
jgi:hypothetical protein